MSLFHVGGFQPIDLNHLVFPAAMYIDYVRVYQREGAPGIGCSPDDYPTANYINKYETSSFHRDFKELTRGQAYECIYESQSHNMEPSRVLLPAQLVVQRLLDSHPVLPWFIYSRLPHAFFFRERHDMLRSLALYPQTPRPLFIPM